MEVKESTIIPMAVGVTAVAGIAWNRSNIVENSTHINVLRTEINTMREQLKEVPNLIAAINKLQLENNELKDAIRKVNPETVFLSGGSMSEKPKKEKKYSRFTKPVVSEEEDFLKSLEQKASKD